MPDIEGLKWFVAVHSVNRDVAPFFVGRASELDALFEHANTARITLHEDGVPPAGHTMIIQGCPGIGKTCLMRQFVQLCNQDFEENGCNGSKPLQLIMSLSQADTTKSIVRELMESDPDYVQMRWVAGLGQDVLSRFKSETTLVDLLRSLGPSIGVRPIVVLIDEIQNATKYNRHFLADLHSGVGYSNNAVLPVYFGLNSSKSQLQSLGLTRFGDDADITLGLLTRDDCRQSFHMMLTKYDVDGDGMEDEWIETMIKDSQYFPHHLTVALRSTAAVLIEHEGVMRREGLISARRQSAKDREHYYRSRIGDDLLTPYVVVGAIAKALSYQPTYLGGSKLEASNALLEIMPSLMGLPKNTVEAGEMFDALVHRGILQMNAETGTYTIPIPSFQTWAAEELG